ncbi:MAG: hypothetical protein ACREEW_16355, partial [Caulobacteraceae bacterium]
MVAHGCRARRWSACAALGIALALLGRSALADPPEQGANASHAPAITGQSPAKDGSRSALSVAERSAQRIATALEAQNAYNQSAEGQKNAQEAAQAAHAAAQWAGWMLLAAAIETFVTFVGVVLVGLTLKAARESARHTQRQADAAERSLRELERPYLLTTKLSAIRESRGERGIAHNIQVTIGNYGRSPAEFTLVRGKFIWTQYLTKESRDANNTPDGNQYCEDVQTRPVGVGDQISDNDFYIPPSIPIIHHVDGRHLPQMNVHKSLFLWIVIE